ncbi:MAG: hypothetical protein LBQ98_03625 [Nitrososphaerota archaeon]|jgi:hypothetical protein|nr:hypothetical protein [Nitrososphaerota archaeon]
MNKEKKEFDERQIEIRKNIFKHGFLITLIALLLNAFLNDQGIVWASVFYQNILIFVLSITIVSIEFHMHDVYFGRGISRAPILGIMGFCVIVLAVLSGIHFANGAAFVANGELTSDGAGVIFCVLFLVSVTCGIIQSLRSKQAEKIMK